MIDTKKEHIAVTEANKLHLPVVAVVDTNCDPDVIDYVIPGNDDAIRAGRLMCRVIADAVVEGKFIASRRAADAATKARRATPEPISQALAPAPAPAMGEPAAFSAVGTRRLLPPSPRRPPPVDRAPVPEQAAEPESLADGEESPVAAGQAESSSEIAQEHTEQDTAAPDIEHVTED